MQGESRDGVETSIWNIDQSEQTYIFAWLYCIMFKGYIQKVAQNEKYVLFRAQEKFVLWTLFFFLDHITKILLF